MSTVKADSGVQEATPQDGGRKPVDWAKFNPKSVDSEDALSDEAVKTIWEKLYKEVAKGPIGEDERRSIRCAVYVYCAKNGTSREGSYNGNMKTSTGLVFPAAALPRAAARVNIRKFMRGNMIESYNYLKGSKVMETEERFIAKVAKLGVAPQAAFATADWLTDCPLFTPAETQAHDISFDRSVERAKRARGGRTLEDVEDGRVQRSLMAQGPAEAGISEDSRW